MAYGWNTCRKSPLIKLILTSRAVEAHFPSSGSTTHTFSLSKEMWPNHPNLILELMSCALQTSDRHCLFFQQDSPAGRLSMHSLCLQYWVEEQWPSSVQGTQTPLAQKGSVAVQSSSLSQPLHKPIWAPFRKQWLVHVLFPVQGRESIGLQRFPRRVTMQMSSAASHELS